jgi:hypothetical protein
MDANTLQFYSEHAADVAARYAEVPSVAARHFHEVFATGGGFWMWVVVPVAI